MFELTPHHVEAVYDCLRQFPPFKRWKLPAAEEVHFSVTRAKDRVGSYCPLGEGHHITASSEKIGHYDTLARLVAHEMVHMKLQIDGFPNWNLHGAAFTRYAASVARYHGFDPKEL
jgi:ribosomal protein S16